MDRGANDLSLKVLLSVEQAAASAAVRGFGSVLGGLKGPAGVVAGAFGAISLAVVGFAAKSVQMAAQYQQSMDMVQALTGSSAAQMAQYDAGLKALAVEAGVAPQQLAQGLYYVISAGYSGATAMNVLSLATKDAVIGMTSQGVTANALTTILKAFSVHAADVTRVNGEMLETVTLGKMTMADYAGAVGKASSVAMQFHVSMENMNASIATLTSNGIPSAHQATTDFTQAVSVMYSKIGTVTSSLHKNGIAFSESAFNAASYQVKIQMMNQALEQAAAKHVAITGVTKQAAAAIQIISQHSQEFSKNLATLSNHQAMAQKTAQAWAITQGGFNETINRAKAALSVLMITIGQALLPILTKLMAQVAPLIGQFTAWLVKSGALKTAGALLAAGILGIINVIQTLVSAGSAVIGFFQHNQLAVDALGAVLITFAIQIASILIPAFIGWAVAAGSAAIATIAATWPIIAAGAIVAAVVLGIILAIQHWGQIMSWIGGIFSWLGAHVHAILSAIGSFFGSMVQGILLVFSPIITVYKDIFMVLLYIVEFFVGVAILLFEGLVRAIKAVFTPIVAFFRMVWSGIVLVFSPIVSWFGQQFHNAWQAIVAVWAVVTGWFKAIWAGIVAVFTPVAHWFGQQFALAGSAVKAVWTPIAAWFGAIFSALGTTVHMVVGKIGDAFSGLGSFVKGIWDGIVNAVKGAINFMIGLINSIIVNIDKIHVNTPFGSIGFSIPQIPKLASGGMVMSGGIVDVHANERMFLPAGTSVAGPGSALAAGSARYSGGGHTTIINFSPTINGWSRGSARMILDDLKQEMAKDWRGNANIQVATSGSTRR